MNLSNLFNIQAAIIYADLNTVPGKIIDIIQIMEDTMTQTTTVCPAKGGAVKTPTAPEWNAMDDVIGGKVETVVR